MQRPAHEQESAQGEAQPVLVLAPVQEVWLRRQADLRRMGAFSWLEEAGRIDQLQKYLVRAGSIRARGEAQQTWAGKSLDGKQTTSRTRNGELRPLL